MLRKTLTKAVDKAVQGNTWKKFTNPSTERGKTAFPRDKGEQVNLGVRWDYDCQVTRADEVYHKFKMQPNAGKVPSSIKRWREANGGTHSVMATAFVKKHGTVEDVREGLTEAVDSVKN